MILGILAAIVVFAVQNLAADSAKVACRTDAKTVEVAQEAYKAKIGAYAPSLAALVPGYVKSEPVSTRYVITTTNTPAALAGKVMVDTPAIPAAVDHNDPSNPCATAI